MNKKIVVGLVLALSVLSLSACSDKKSEEVVNNESTIPTDEVDSTDNGMNSSDGSTVNSDGSTATPSTEIPKDAVFAKTAAEAEKSFKVILDASIAGADKASKGKKPTVDDYLKSMFGVNVDYAFTKLGAVEEKGALLVSGESGKLKCSATISYANGSSKSSNLVCK